MIGTVLGILLMIIGGLMAVGVALTILGGVFGLAVLVAKVVVPLLLLYWGYRLMVGNRDACARTW